MSSPIRKKQKNQAGGNGYGKGRDRTRGNSPGNGNGGRGARPFIYGIIAILIIFIGLNGKDFYGGNSANTGSSGEVSKILEDTGSSGEVSKISENADSSEQGSQSAQTSEENITNSDEINSDESSNLSEADSKSSGATLGKPSSKSTLHFRSEELLEEHFEKHGREMGFSSPEEYETAASEVVGDPESLSKDEASEGDGDTVYYRESTNDLVIVSADGFIRTFFRPDDGIAYYNRT
ncbi:MAG: hypothetical protein VZR00_08985 [Lachnospiraceae bacterium]|jgi:pyocin large subunit-like protein|nr:hypothetical protein [Lachnospiraceae bacterium]MEE3462003.1 hypothetical protein [Lachnospiraceae bacterium]